MEVCKCSGWKTRSRAGRWGFALAVSILLCLCDEAGCSGKNDIKVDLSKLTIDQLRSFHTQLGTDESLLVKSYKQLRVASNAFYDSRQAIKALKPEAVGNPVLLPITKNLYVKGTLASADRLLVDVGTGYFVEKNTTSAEDYFRRKVEFVSSNMKTVEGQILDKRKGVEIVSQYLQARVQESRTK